MATIKKRGESYLIRASDGYGSGHKQIKKNMTWTPEPGMKPAKAKEEAFRQATLFEERVRTGRVIDGNIKFSDFSEIWLRDYAAGHLEPKTYYRYSQLLVRINESIGHIRLDKLQPKNLIELYNALADPSIRSDASYFALPDTLDKIEAKTKYHAEFARLAGVASNTIMAVFDKKPVREKSMNKICRVLDLQSTDSFIRSDKKKKLASRTILHHHRLISSILSTAVQWQVLFNNPAERVSAPRVERSESNYLDENQAKQVIEQLQDEPIQYRTMITLLIYSGIRRGELCGLEWNDIDFDKNIIHVRRSLQYLPDRGIFNKDTKTLGSVRSIKLSAIVFIMLKQYKAWQNSERLKLKDTWIESNKLFTKWNGDPIHPDTITHWFDVFIKKHDLPHASIHSLRHTNATLLIAGGTDIRTVSNRLGHSQTSTTMNIYSHAIRSADEAAAETLENLLDPMEKKSIKKASE